MGLKDMVLGLRYSRGLMLVEVASKDLPVGFKAFCQLRLGGFGALSMLSFRLAQQQHPIPETISEVYKVRQGLSCAVCIAGGFRGFASFGSGSGSRV